MNIKVMTMAVVAAVLAGCATTQNCCSKKCCKDDPCLGEWGLQLPFDFMSAGHIIISRDENGQAQGLWLYRWASPEKTKSCEITQNKFKIQHAWGPIIEGYVCGNKLFAKLTENGKDLGDVYGWRNDPACPKASTKDAKFGEPIDLLADGMDGWKLMSDTAKNGWSFKDGVLINKLGLKADGSWAGGGANLMTKRADFYDFNLEYDVRVPANSNSGVYLRGRYEVQVVDSFGKPVNEHNMAAYYGRVVPSVAAEKPAGEWQHVSVTLYKKHLTVVLNGVTIIDDVPMTGCTGGAIDAREDLPGPIYLQGDHSDADYRNMILRKAL